MIKTLKIVVVVIMCFISIHVKAQLNEWTWMHGDFLVNQNGVYGAQGVPGPLNKPPSTYEGCQWTDLNGNFWLYGGQYNGVSFFSDLWKYDPATNEWAWMHGPGGTMGLPAVHGTQGVPAPTNSPGARGWAPSSWVDHNNNLWMFAGCNEQSQDMNDLWMYNISTNEWTWMKGSNFPSSPGSTGVMGVPSLTNVPSARHESTCSWIDGNGDLWTFGGFGFTLTDDLWRYSISTNMWTWMKGDPVNSDPPVFGLQGVPNPLNTPGARCAYSRWADQSGNLWLFGGLDFTYGTCNDLWKYNIATGEWAWMKGPNVSNDQGNYISLCVEDSLSNPSARFESRSCWTDSCGHFWMFAGSRAGASDSLNNDLWKFNPVSNNWTWVSGLSSYNDPGNYGSLGLSSPANVPPARMGAYAWQDVDGNLWLGSGWAAAGAGMMNDLWRFVPDPACSGCVLTPVAVFSAPNDICPGTCTDFTNLSVGATSFIWNFPGANPSVSTDANPTSICYNTPGNYDVTLIATNSTSSDTLTLSNYISVYPYPPPQGIMQSGDTLFANAGAVSYQWYYNGNIIPGATDFFYVAMQSGNFNVVATDNNNCEVEAAIFDVIAGIQSAVGGLQFAIFPNPVTEVLNVTCNKGIEPEFSIYNVIGEIVMSVKPDSRIDYQEWSIDVSSLPDGIYWLNIFSDKFTTRISFTKQ